ncbi:hypothetical protein P3L10_026099 [Capsicum annuum]
MPNDPTLTTKLNVEFKLIKGHKFSKEGSMSCRNSTGNWSLEVFYHRLNFGPLGRNCWSRLKTRSQNSG